MIQTCRWIPTASSCTLHGQLDESLCDKTSPGSLTLRCTSQSFDGSRRPSGDSQAITCTACGPLTRCKNIDIGPLGVANWLVLAKQLVGMAWIRQTSFAGSCIAKLMGRSGTLWTLRKKSKQPLGCHYVNHVSPQFGSTFHWVYFHWGHQLWYFWCCSFFKAGIPVSQFTAFPVPNSPWYLGRHMPLWERSEGGIFVGERGAGSGHGDSNACNVSRSHLAHAAFLKRTLWNEMTND